MKDTSWPGRVLPPLNYIKLINRWRDPALEKTSTPCQNPRDKGEGSQKNYLTSKSPDVISTNERNPDTQNKDALQVYNATIKPKDIKATKREKTKWLVVRMGRKDAKKEFWSQEESITGAKQKPYKTAQPSSANEEKVSTKEGKP